MAGRQERRSVIAASFGPEYMLALTKGIQKASIKEFSKDQAYEIIVKEALKRQYEKELAGIPSIYAMRRGYGDETAKLTPYGKRGLEKSTELTLDLACLPYINIFKKINAETYTTGDNFERVCKDGKTALLDLFIRQAVYENSPFKPRRFILKLRNYTPTKIKLVGKKGSIELEGTDGGITYFNDLTFIEEFLYTNPVSLTAMAEWGKFFDLTEYFNEVFSIKHTEIRTKSLILTKRVASVQEILDMLSIFAEHGEKLTYDKAMSIFAEKTRLNRYAIKSILACCIELGIIEQVNDLLIAKAKVTPNDIFAQAINKGMMIIVDTNREGYLVFKENDLSGLLRDPYGTYVLTDERIRLEDFYNKLHEVYIEVSGGYEFAPVNEVKRLVCKKLMISKSRFDDLLTNLYTRVGPGVINLATGIPKRRGEEPFNLFGTSYFYIRVIKG